MKPSPTSTPFPLRRALRLALRHLDKRDHFLAEVKIQHGKAFSFDDKLVYQLLLEYCDLWMDSGGAAPNRRVSLRAGLKASWEKARAGDMDRLFEIAFLFGCSKTRDDRDRADAWIAACAEHYEQRQDAEARFRLGIIYDGLGDTENNTLALACLQQAAEAGHAHAAYELGVHHWEGKLIPQNDQETEKWLRLAAEHGSTLAVDYVFALGVRFLLGHQTDVDFAHARHWLEIAADLGEKEAISLLADTFHGEELSEKDQQRQHYWTQVKISHDQDLAHAGDPQAQLDLALRYEHGDGTDKDPATAAKWFEEAFRGFLYQAQHSDPTGEAAHHVADCYQFGQGVAKNASRAMEWLDKASEDGDAMALSEIVRLINDLDGISPVTPLQVATWMTRADTLRNADAFDELCDYAVRRGQTCEWNMDKSPANGPMAVEWYRTAANVDWIEAQVLLAQYYEAGHGESPDQALAHYWYRKAAINNQHRAELGNPYAQRDLACLYEEGKGVAQNPTLAKKWFLCAVDVFRQRADSGDPVAQCELADMYCCGAGVDFDPEEAEKWYQAASAKGWEHAEQHYGNFCMKMGCMCLGLEHDHGAMTDRRSAVQWLRKGAKLGNAHAMDALDYLQQQEVLD